MGTGDLAPNFGTGDLAPFVVGEVRGKMSGAEGMGGRESIIWGRYGSVCTSLVHFMSIKLPYFYLIFHISYKINFKNASRLML